MSDTADDSTMWLSPHPAGDGISLFCTLCDKHVEEIGLTPSVYEARAAEIRHWATHEGEG